MSPENRPSIRLGTINMDCADAQAMADFYGRLLGWEVSGRDHDFILMQNPDGGIGLSFRRRRGTSRPSGPNSLASRRR